MILTPSHFDRRRLAPLILPLLVLLGLSVVKVQAQFSVRESTVLPESLIGDGARSGSGKFTMTTAVFGGFEFNDNVNLTPDAQSGVSLTAGLKLTQNYPISAKNDLAVDLAVTHLTYLSGPASSKSYTSILPGSSTVFTVFAGPVRVRTFLSTDLSEDPVTSPEITRTSRFGRFNAQAGAQADWDMNYVTWQLTGTAGRQLSTQEVNEQIDLWRYSVGLRAVFPINSEVFWGLSATADTTRYDEQIQNESTSWSTGVFGQIPLSRSMRLEAAAGVQSTDYDATGSISDRSNYQGGYGSLTFSHQLRRTLSYTLTAKHDIDDGYGSNYYRVTEVAFAPRITILKNWDLVGRAGWEWIGVSGPGGERATRLTLSLEARHPLGRRFDGTVGVARYQRDSDQSQNDYTQNRVYCSVRYTF